MQPTMYDVEALVAPALAESVQEPFGVVLLIGPFNYPIQLAVIEPCCFPYCVITRICCSCVYCMCFSSYLSLEPSQLVTV